MILECGEQVRLGDVPGVAGLGEQAQVREPKLPHQLPRHVSPLIMYRRQQGVDDDKSNKDRQQHGRGDKVDMRFEQDPGSSVQELVLGGPVPFPVGRHPVILLEGLQCIP